MLALARGVTPHYTLCMPRDETTIPYRPADSYFERKHPDTHHPWGEWSEDQTLHIIVPYINQWRWKTRRELANDCIFHLRQMPNVQVHVIEVAFGDRPFEVTGGDRNDIQLRTNEDTLWQKERCLNIAAARLPPGHLYAGYCDSDLTMTRHDFALEAIHMLQHYDFVQLFGSFVDETGEVPTSNGGHRPYRISSTFAHNFLHQREFLENATNNNRMDPGYFGRKIKEKAFPFGFWPGAPGGAWAWRKESFSKVGGMLDTCILGSGDYHQAVGLAGLKDAHAEMQLGLEEYTRAIRDWQKRAAKIQGNIGCVDNLVIHHWHGNKISRGYGDRPSILKAHKFSPYTDISQDWQGLWKLNGDKPRFRDDIRKYWLARNEDNPVLLDAKRPLV